MARVKYLMLSVFFALLFIASCSEDEPAINEAEVLVNYLESADSPLGKDYVNSDLPSIIKATEVKTLNATDDVYIIDIRKSTDFDNGHIDKAVNVSLGDILTHVQSTDLSGYSKIAVVCYSGQTAGFATSLLRLMGIDNIFSMKWGMSAWHSDFATPWTGTVENGNKFATQFTTDVTEKGPENGLPALSTGKTTGKEILEARVNALLSEGYTPAKISNQAVFDNKDDYYIVNYWKADHYNDPGHIPGAIQYTPKSSIALDADLKTLPTDKAVVVYCYTGQTSSFMAAYLRLLGYDAKSLLFGTNGMIYDKCVEKQMTVYNAEQTMDYGYVK